MRHQDLTKNEPRARRISLEVRVRLDGLRDRLQFRIPRRYEQSREIIRPRLAIDKERHHPGDGDEQEDATRHEIRRAQCDPVEDIDILCGCDFRLDGGVACSEPDEGWVASVLAV
jgi:hypothetical protein